jgi:hypothetical protein
LERGTYAFAQTRPVPHGRLFSLAAAALQTEGYTLAVRDSGAARGLLRTTPRLTLPGCLAHLEAAVPHPPELVVSIMTSGERDTSRVYIVAETLRSTPPIVVDGQRMEGWGLALRFCSMAMISTRLDSLIAGARP